MREPGLELQLDVFNYRVQRIILIYGNVVDNRMYQYNIYGGRASVLSKLMRGRIWMSGFENKSIGLCWW